MAHYLSSVPQSEPISDQTHDFTTPIETATRFLDDLRRITKEMTLQSKPDGSWGHPARSCRDIADYYPDKSNGSLFLSRIPYRLVHYIFAGLYYIDPNEGSKNDAVLVFCYLTERWTCVNATHGLYHLDGSRTDRVQYGKPFRFMKDLFQQMEVRARFERRDSPTVAIVRS